jgi:multiple sugar transport system permease protein
MRMSLRMQKQILPYLFILPALVLFCIFMVYPLLKGFQISFYSWSIMPNKPSIFTGMENYIRVFSDKIAGVAFKNTVNYVLVTVPAQMAIAMFIAVLINGVSRGKIFFRTIYYIPVITSWVIVSLLFKYLFQSPQGVINYFLVDGLHITKKAVPFLQQAKWGWVSGKGSAGR